MILLQTELLKEHDKSYYLKLAYKIAKGEELTKKEIKGLIIDITDIDICFSKEGNSNLLCQKKEGYIEIWIITKL